MHFTRSSSSQKMMVELIGAANDICTLHGVCAHLGDNQEDLESRQAATSIFLTPVSELASSSKAPLRNNFCCYA